MVHHATRWFFGVSLLVGLAWPSRAWADSLSIVYTSSQIQTGVVGSGFVQVVFTGFVTNNTSSPITFQLTGGPEPFEPYVASFIDGIPFPGITLAAGQSTGVIDLAIVNLNPFDPSLPYPGTVNIVLDAISVNGGQTGGTITENDATVDVVHAVPEPGMVQLLGATWILGAALLLARRRVALGLSGRSQTMSPTLHS
jgi:hypothetical protein